MHYSFFDPRTVGNGIIRDIISNIMSLKINDKLCSLVPNRQISIPFPHKLESHTINVINS